MGTSGYMFLEKLNANIRYLKTALDRSNLWLELYVIPHFVTFVCQFFHNWLGFKFTAFFVCSFVFISLINLQYKILHKNVWLCVYLVNPFKITPKNLQIPLFMPLNADTDHMYNCHITSAKHRLSSQCHTFPVFKVIQKLFIFKAITDTISIHKALNTIVYLQFCSLQLCRAKKKVEIPLKNAMGCLKAI